MKWINILEETPEENIPVLALDYNGDYGIINMQEIEGKLCVCDNLCYSLVTDSMYKYWLPLPEKHSNFITPITGEISSEAETKQCNKHIVTVSLPSDKVIEDWYTKDFDSLNVRFWEEAPYCTHGDRVEEIKDAVHYFITGNER